MPRKSMRRVRLRGRLLAAAAATLTACPALAQEAAPRTTTDQTTTTQTTAAPKATALPPVAVDAAADSQAPAGAPLTATTLTPAQIARARIATSDTTELMSAIPGAGAYGAGGFSSLPALDGLNDERLNVLVDGAPVDVACPNHMNPALSYTDPQTVQQITAVTGVTPVSAGGDSIGGAIVVDTAQPRFADHGRTLVTGEVASFYRSNGGVAGGSASVTLASDTLSLTYAGSGVRSADYKGGGHDGVVRSTEYEKTDQSVSLAARTAAGLFRLQAGLQWSPYEGFPNQFMDMTFNRSWFLNGRYDGSFAWGDLKATAYYRDTDHKMNFLADKGGDADGGMPMDTQVRTAGYSVSASILLSSRDTLRVGDEFHHEALNDYWPPVAGSMMMGPDTFINIDHAHRDRLGTFVEWQAGWTDRWSTLVGVRDDLVWMNTGKVQPYSTGMMSMADAAAATAFNAADHARFNDNLGASALVRYAPDAHAAFELSYAHKTRSPSLYELYAWGRGAMSSQMIGWFGDGNGYVGNLALKPEIADTISATAAFQGGGRTPWNLKISPYYTHVTDYIDVIKLADLKTMMGMPSGFVQLRFANQAAELYGADVSGSVQLLNAAGVGRIELKGAAGWVHGQNLDTGTALYHMAPLNGRLTIEHSLGGWDSAADLVLVSKKSRVDTVRNEPETAGYALVNLRTGYTWRNVRLDLEVENLFDRAYALPLGGVSLGDYDATGVLRATPGRGRSLDVALGVKF
jgi:iron complex outermembrane recepter protein